MDDFDLLDAYASHRAEDAFSELTARYVDLVYSAAVRQSGDVHKAKDITQAVFLILARKAGSLKRDTFMSGWLLRTTRFAAANVRRLEERRRQYEHQAMSMLPSQTESDSSWESIAPLLDEALDRLNAQDRKVVLWRYFDHKSLREIAETLGTTEDATQKRLSRALEKLRAVFGRQGRTVSVVALTSALATKAVQSAPLGTAATIGVAVRSQTDLAGSSLAQLVKVTATAMARARWRWLAMQAATPAVILVLAILVVSLGGHLSDKFRLGAANTEPYAVRVQNEPVLPALQAAGGTLAKRPIRSRTKDLVLHVLNAQSGAPVSAVHLTLVSSTEWPQQMTNIFATDDQGTGLVTYSPRRAAIWSHCIEVYTDGYVPKFVSWSSLQQDAPDEIPEEYTVKLDPAVTIGGFVRSVANTAVADAQVVLSVSGPISNARERLTMMGNYHTEVTDLQGHWRCNHVPARFGIIGFHVVHPQFQEKTFASDSPDSPNDTGLERISAADYLAERALMRIEPGLAVAGIVTDEDQQPVAGAKVSQNFDFHRPDRNFVTGSDGQFRFQNIAPSELSLTIQAEGLAPVVTSLVMKASIEKAHILLPAGRLLRGRVVDSNGQAIAGASIEAASPSADSRTLFQWRTKTDSDGLFFWDAAPAQQKYEIEASGFESHPPVTLIADGTEQRVELRNANTDTVLITGRVLDAETRSPAPSARVQIWQTQTKPGGGWSSFTTVPEPVRADGSFRIRTSPGITSYVLEGQADGYRPERITNNVTAAAEIELNLDLHRAPVAAGVVFTPAGEPAQAATLAVCSAKDWPQLAQTGKLQIGPHASVSGVTADERGRFRLPTVHAPELVVIAHPSGFAQLPFSEISSNTTISLKAWGRIEGTLQLAGKPVTGQPIWLNGMPWRRSAPRIAMVLTPITDEAGHFSFDSVPAGEWIVERQINADAEMQAGFRPDICSHGVPVLVASGEVAHVELGGGGRPVVGKAVLTNTNGLVRWVNQSVTLALDVPAPGAPKQPRRVQFQSDREYRAALDAFREESWAFWSSESALAIQRQQRFYRAMFAADGSFHLDDVPPGKYLLEVSVFEPMTRAHGGFLGGRELGRLETAVTVPPSDSDSKNNVVDLGSVEVSSVSLTTGPE